MNDYVIYPKQLGKQTIPVERNHCFFLMPFGREFDIIYGTIKQYLNDENFTCTRADEISGSTPIISKILTGIVKAQYVIVDLTQCNPNVFYELGIAHTLKEARNVILLKQKNYDVPFDIKHLTYTEYDPNNLKYIATRICTFLRESKTKNEFYEALIQHGIINFIDESNNEFIEIILSGIPENLLECLTQNLLIDGCRYDNSTNNESLLALRKLISDFLIKKEYKTISKLIDVYYAELSSIPECDNIRVQIEQILHTFYEQFDINDNSVREYKTKLALLLAKKDMYMDLVLPWIITYFSRTKSTTIDLNRYSVENFLMTSDSNQVDEVIVNSLYNSDCYVREHMSDIIGEKKLFSAVPVLFKQLATEENYFTAQSIFEAIGKLNAEAGIEHIVNWVDNHKKDIISTKQLFVLKHAFIAIKALDKSTDRHHIEKFEKEFGHILKDYYII